MLQGWPIQLVTKLDYVNRQVVPFEVVSQPPEAMYKLAACYKSKFCNHSNQTALGGFFQRKTWDFI